MIAASGIDGQTDLTMFSPWHARCGVRDYTVHLVRSLDKQPRIASVRIVPAPPDAARFGLIDAISHFREDERRYQSLGSAMNDGANVAHIQHQYFLFGGVSPAKSHIRAFLGRLTIPSVMTVHEIAESPGQMLGGAVVSLANRINFLHPTICAWIVHTDADRRRLLQIGCPAERVHRLPHPVPPALRTPSREMARAALEARYPALSGRRILTLFGFLSAKKGHRLALDALAGLPDDVALVFAGDRHPDDRSAYVASVRQEITLHGLQDRVVTTGYLPDEMVPEVMAATDLALAPFLQSSGSGSLANLLAYGRAVVASDIAPHRELCADAPGLLALVPARDSAALAKEILRLLSDEVARRRLEQAALEYAALHTYDVMARATVAIYESVLGRRPIR